jgi:hypothetical protein
MQREPGFYWVKFEGKWNIGHCGPSFWTVFADERFFDETQFAAIGPRISPPEEN